MTYPEHLLTEDETVVVDFHPHWRVLLLPILWTLAIIAMAVAVLWWGDRQDWDLNLGLWVPLVALVLILVFVAAPVVRWLFTQYVLTTERIIVRSGIIAKTGTEIPLETINNVLFSQSPTDRMLGHGDVIIESAGSHGQSRLTDIPDPERFQSLVYRTREDRKIAFESSAGGPRDAVAQLEALSALHDAGKLTDAEFATKKAQLLGG